MQILPRQRGTQRNITPNFVIMKSKSGHKNLTKQKSQNSSNPSRTDRSSSKNSKCSFEAYERRVLHLSKLKNNLISKNKNSEINEPIKITAINNTLANTYGIQDSRRSTSNSLKKDKVGRENNIYIGLGRRAANHNDNSLSRKKSSGSGKIIFRPHSRSNSKRDQDSLEKQQQRAKIMNAQLLTDLAKHSQAPNYINKLKLKKTQKQIKEKKKETLKPNMLHLNIQIKGPDTLKEYEIYGELGKGAYGIVRMGVNKKNGEKVAIKFYPKKNLDELNRLKNLQREISILAQLCHPIIAKLIDAIQTSTDIYLVMQYGGANSLYNYLLSKHEHRLKEYEAKKFLHTIAQTIGYLHHKNIVHRDIKAENILINRYKDLKLIDFGFSIHSVPPNTIDTFCGTPTYMAPQIVSKVDHVPIYTDMWSLGILYFVMLQGNYPFRSRNEEDLFEKIRKGKFQYLHHDISDESKKLIESLLKINPYERLKITDIFSNKYDKFFEDARLDENVQ